MNTAPDLAHLTQWLAEQPADEASRTGEQLFVLLYQQLRQQARAQLRKEGAGHTLSPTALVHEAWFRMAEQTRAQ